MADMGPHRALGTTGFEVSPLCLGTMQLGWTIPDEDDCFALLDAFSEAGGNFIDTANMYGPDQNLQSFAKGGERVGVAETIIGNWMKARGNRDDMVVATKVRARMWDGDDGEGLSRTHIERAVEGSLERLQVDSIDIYLAHFPDAVPLDETMSAFGDLVAAGKAKTIGSSNFPGPLMEAAKAAAETVGSPQWTSVQPRYSLVNRAEYEADLMDFCVRENVACFPFSPLAGGFLTGKYRRDEPVADSVRAGFCGQYLNEQGFSVLEALSEVAAAHDCSVAEAAIAWALHQPQVVSAVVGANSPEQLAGQLKGGTITLDADELARLDAVSWQESAPEFTSW
ncbi:MAG: aldo/keto reductase [Acidimicrobiia bacterium]|nr:aldo/keto reductase [Acidimicrobiia bacterium]